MNLLELPPDEPQTAAEIRARARRVVAQRQEMRRLQIIVEEPEPEPPPPPPPPPPLEVMEIPNFLTLRAPLGKRIIQACAEYFCLTVEHLLSEVRTKQVVDGRHIGMYLARHHTKKSYPQIARMFGRNDHSTALHGVMRATALIRSGNAEFIKAVEEIERKALA